MYVSFKFCYRSFLLWSIFSPPVQLKRLYFLRWAYFRLIRGKRSILDVAAVLDPSLLIIFRANWWQNIKGKRFQVAHYKLNDVNYRPQRLFMHTQFCVHQRARETILRARKSVHANIQFVEPWLLSLQDNLILIWSVLEGWKTESTLFSDDFWGNPSQLTRWN